MNIEVKDGRTGALTPTAIFEPNLLKNKLEIKKIKIIQNKSKIAVE